MASIRQRGERWCVRWWDLSGRQRERTCPNLATAKRLKAQIEREQALGRDWRPERRGALVELPAVALAFLEAQRPRLRRSTIERYAVCLDYWIDWMRRRHGSYMPSDLLERQLLERYYGDLLAPGAGQHGRTRSASTANEMIGVVHTMWRWAEESGRWPGEIPRPRRIPLAQARGRAVVAPTWAEMDACVLALEPGTWARRLATVLRYAGLRPGEVLLLEWEAVSLDDATATLYAETVKSGPGRVIPLSPHLVDEMAGWGVREGRVIAGATADRRALSRLLRAAWKKAGVRDAVWSHHASSRALRRGWKSGMLGLGANADAVDYLQGHTLSRGSARGSYIDPWQALPLRETVAMVPKIGESKVVPLRRSK
jgi:integrase